MDEDEIPFLQDLRAAYTKRLRILLIRQATKGINLSPEDVIEIQNIKEQVIEIEKKLGDALKGNMIISDAILSSSHTENRHLDYTYLSDIGNLLDMSSDESVNIVSCLVSALIFSIKFDNQDLESFCFHELTGWASIEENKMPKYRKINGYIEHKSFLKRLFSQDSVVARCQILARESIGQVEAIRSAPSVGTLLYIYATLGGYPET